MRHRVLLLLPPASEARFFPYLSLPQLAAHLRAIDVPVRQVDLNIELAHHLSRTECAEAYLANCQTRTQSRSGQWGVWEARALRELAAPSRKLVYGRSDRQKSRATDVAVKVLTLLTERQLQSTGFQATIREYREIPELLEGLLADRSGNPVGTFLRHRAEQLLNEFRPTVVGLSVPFFSQFLSALYLARVLREMDHGLAIALGGPFVQRHCAGLLSVPGLLAGIDFLCTGPGEHAFESILGSRFPSSRSPSVIFGGVDLRDAGPPSFEGLPVDSYLNQEFHLGLTTCLGCWWGRCSFCSYGNVNHRAYQEKSRDQLIGEFSFLMDRFQCTQINLADENTNLALALAAMRSMARNGRETLWSARCRFEKRLTSLKFCTALADAGCKLLFMGLDSTSQRLLDGVNRGIQVMDFEPILDNLERVGIKARISVMLGLPGESRAEAEATHAMIVANLGRCHVDAVQQMIPEPLSFLLSNDGQGEIALQGGNALMSNPDTSYCGGRYGPARRDAPAVLDLLLDVLRKSAEVQHELERNERWTVWERLQGQPLHMSMSPGTVALEGEEPGTRRLFNLLDDRTVLIHDALALAMSAGTSMAGGIL